MRILLTAPHPWYQDRGTPIAVDLLIKVLTEDGHVVDLLTFNEGIDKTYPNFTIHRVKPVGNISGVIPGFSLKKLYLDIFLFFKMIRMVATTRYDVIHSVEESAFFGMLFSKLTGAKFVYDMDSSIASQLVDRFPRLGAAKKILKAIESWPIRTATAVVPVCDALADEARQYRDDGIFVVKDVSLVSESVGDENVIDVREHIGNSDRSVFMYIGNLESYQGIELMLDGFALSKQGGTDAELVIVGGSEERIDFYKNYANSKGIGDRCHFLGQQPVAHIDNYMRQSDVLVSPRIQGKNTPMKLYSYLDSGRAVLATDLPTHTQVVDSNIAILCKPVQESFAEAIDKLDSDPALRSRVAEAAKIYIQKNHSFPVLERQIKELYQYLESSS